jgi:hypothetical protein
MIWARALFKVPFHSVAIGGAFAGSSRGRAMISRALRALVKVPLKLVATRAASLGCIAITRPRVLIGFRALRALVKVPLKLVATRAASVGCIAILRPRVLIGFRALHA